MKEIFITISFFHLYSIACQDAGPWIASIKSSNPGYLGDRCNDRRRRGCSLMFSKPRPARSVRVPVRLSYRPRLLSVMQSAFCGPFLVSALHLLCLSWLYYTRPAPPCLFAKCMDFCFKIMHFCILKCRSFFCYNNIVKVQKRCPPEKTGGHLFAAQQYYYSIMQAGISRCKSA